jgi:hypothetical protein
VNDTQGSDPVSRAYAIGAGLAGAATNATGVGLLSHAYLRPFNLRKPAANAARAVNKDDLGILRSLRKLTKDIPVGAGSLDPSAVNTDTMKAINQRLSRLLGPHYNPQTNRIGLPHKDVMTSNLRGSIVGSRDGRHLSNMGVLAHEAGHARQPKWSMTARNASKPLSVLGHFMTLLSKDEDYGAAGAGLGALGMAPTLLNEADASYRGSKMLSQAARLAGKPLSLGRRLSPWLGFPTYALATASPFVVHGVKKQLGGYNPE